MAAGDGLCVAEAVRVLVHDGPRYVRELIDWGVAFDRDSNGVRRRFDAALLEFTIAIGVEGRHKIKAMASETSTDLTPFRLMRHSDQAAVFPVSPDGGGKCQDSENPLLFHLICSRRPAPMENVR